MTPDGPLGREIPPAKRIILFLVRSDDGETVED